MSEDALILKNEFDLLMCICNRKKDDFELLKSLIGSYVAINISDDKIINVFKYVYNSSLNDIILDINKKDEKKKVLKK